MLYVDKNNNIRLTRGDTAKFVVSVQNESIKQTNIKGGLLYE